MVLRADSGLCPQGSLLVGVGDNLGCRASTPGPQASFSGDTHANTPPAGPPGQRTQQMADGPWPRPRLPALLPSPDPPFPFPSVQKPPGEAGWREGGLGQKTGKGEADVRGPELRGKGVRRGLRAPHLHHTASLSPEQTIPGPRSGRGDFGVGMEVTQAPPPQELGGQHGKPRRKWPVLPTGAGQRTASLWARPYWRSRTLSPPGPTTSLSPACWTLPTFPASPLWAAMWAWLRGAGRVGSTLSRRAVLPGA